MKENEPFSSYTSKSFCTRKNYTKDVTGLTTFVLLWGVEFPPTLSPCITT
jgi:hypothetical protein